jgi:pimeloyl-ACP methyl ester carboxylesterase
LTTYAVLKLIGVIALFLFGCLLAWLFFVDGIVGRIVYDARPTIIGHNLTGKKPAFVFFTGLQSSGETHSAPLRSLWAEHYDVIVVEYNPNRFDDEVITSETHDYLVARNYRTVILDGASRGLMLATDQIDYDRTHGNHFDQIAVVSEDGFSDAANDLQDPKGAKIGSKLYPGPAANFLLTKLVWHFFYKPPARETLGPDVDDAMLDAHHQYSRTQPLSGWTDGIRSFVNHRPYRDGEYAGITFIAMVSEHDGDVKKSAAERLIEIFGGGQIIEVPGTSHVDFVEHPKEWREAFEAVTSQLPR